MISELERAIATVAIGLSVYILALCIRGLWRIRRRSRQKAHNAKIMAEVMVDARKYHKRYPFTNRDTGGSRYLAGAKRWNELEKGLR